MFRLIVDSIEIMNEVISLTTTIPMNMYMYIYIYCENNLVGYLVY